MKAVIYTRVSSEEQVSNLSLDVQEKTCREYCARNGWTVDAVYREEGESAKTANRTALRRMLEDLRSRSVDFVVVYDTSRFARDVYVHTSLKQLLSKAGTQLRAATQPLEDTAAGRAIEGVFAVFNQLDNELRAEKITAGMKETISRGLWPWPAPLGFRNDRSAEGRKVIVHDGRRGELMRQGFESVAAGDPPADVLRRLTSLGLVSKKGRPVRYQEFRRFLRNPFYKGVTKSEEWGIETQGQHQPLVDPITWSRVQQRLDGRYGQTVEPPRLKENPEFPLRGFVRCAACGKPMTASNSRGKMGKTYPYYRCWIKGCGAAQVRAERLEQSFSDHLRSVEISPGTVRLVKAALLDVWSELRTESGHQAANAKRRITELDRRKQRLVQAYVYDQALDRPTYDRELLSLDESLTLANLELRDAQFEDLDLEAALGYASALLISTSRIWQTATAPKKRRLQPLLFPEGITFDGEAIGTPVTAFVFSVLGQQQAGMDKLVEQKGLEPSTPTLRTWCSPS
jgi:site-specific DNA recombinase